MRVSTRTAGEATVVDVAGEVDMFTSPDLRKELSRLTGDSVPKVVVNLESVSFMDSSGIATLVQALKEMRPFGGRLVLAAPGDTVQRVLRLSNLTSLFEIHDTVEGATAE
jgi:anti-sigma B factor antagonist